MAIFEGKKSSNNILHGDTMSGNEVVASYVPPRNEKLRRNSDEEKDVRLSFSFCCK